MRRTALFSVGTGLLALTAACQTPDSSLVSSLAADKPAAAGTTVTFTDAKAVFRECSSSARVQNFYDYPVRSAITQTDVTDGGFVWTLKDGKRLQYAWKDVGKTYVDHYGSWGNVPVGVGSAVRSLRADGTRAVWVFLSQGERNRKLAADCAEAMQVLARGIPAESAEEIARFEGIARSFREANPRPQMPEDARRFRVRAEAAVAEKRFEDAGDRYEEAIKVVPWWPEGRFNRALVLGEIGRYTEAIREMKKYLALVPEAANARAAQDRIYAWEDKARGP